MVNWTKVRFAENVDLRRDKKISKESTEETVDVVPHLKHGISSDNLHYKLVSFEHKTRNDTGDIAAEKPFRQEV